MAELRENTKSEFRIATPESPFNFEFDMELIQTLPWRRGYVADIVFYDPGLQPPAHYLFREAGEAKLRVEGGRECGRLAAAHFASSAARSRQTAAITASRVGPRKRPTTPKVSSPPTMPSSASTSGNCAAPAMNTGRTK